MRDRQTTADWQQLTDAATETEGSHTVNVQAYKAGVQMSQSTFTQCSSNTEAVTGMSL